jgi:riboflavin kinase/FMN adenylyltransferase
MRIVRTLAEVTQTDRGATAAIGNFDGVHLGHRAVIDLARDTAPEAPLGVLTFEPHPRAVFQPDAPPFRLMDANARAHRLEKLGVDILFELPFEPALYNLTHDAFCADVLAAGLGLSNVTVGADFCYGKGRTGNVQTLRAAGGRLGFGVTIAELISGSAGEVSSTAIRQALTDGHPEQAAEMLGHWHRIEGPVIHGEKRGRDLGFPTANMDISHRHLPRFGVYAVTVDVLDGPHAGSYRGAASLGVRPMFGENTPNLETFLFDFSGDLYGATLSVGLVAFLRPEMAWEGVEKLIEQMGRDCVQAREILTRLT